VVCLVPRAREDIVRPRRVSAVVSRPLNFTVSSHVDRYHFVVTAALALCAAAFTIGFVWKLPGLLGVSALLGWAISVVALGIALVLVIVLAYRSLSGTARPLLRRSWLGLVNGALGAAVFVYSVL
jgi:hypothetical protein